jgi:hypothetical protein
MSKGAASRTDMERFSVKNLKEGEKRMSAYNQK